MKIAVVSEGRTEYACLPMLYPQIKEETGDVLLNPTYAQIPPTAPIGRVVKECLKALRVVAVSKPDLVVILLDREQADAPSGRIAAELEAAIAEQHVHPFEVRVVIKDRMFENWLVADLNALAAQPKRYDVTDALRRQVEPNKADRVAALELLKRASRNGQYDKVNDGKRTSAHLDVLRAGAHSRSFRHFLHVMRHPAYAEQCLRPDRS